MENVAKCIITGCEGKLVSRGLCSKCATAARKAVKEGKVSWAWLEKNGLATPVRRRRTSVDSPFSAQLQSSLRAMDQAGEAELTGRLSVADAQAAYNAECPTPLDGAHSAADGPEAPISSPVAPSVAVVDVLVPKAENPPCPSFANSKERQAARERRVARAAAPVLDIPDESPSNVADLAAEHAHREQLAEALANDAPPALPWEQ